MPQTRTTTTPTIAPTVEPIPQPELMPSEVCTQQTRESASPDVAP